jgi:hypothetical protein
LNKRNGIALLVVVLALACAALPAQAQLATLPQFSADMTTKHGGESTQGKIYFGSNKIRMDMNAGGRDMQMITDILKKTSYMIMPQQRMYMEMSATGPMAGARGRTPDVKPVDPNNPCANQPGVTCKKVGTETVNGRACDKWEFTGDGKHTAWIDQKLHIPVKTVSSDGATMELTNIKEGAQPASLFEIPAGYQKMDMGGMMRQRPE